MPGPPPREARAPPPPRLLQFGLARDGHVKHKYFPANVSGKTSAGDEGGKREGDTRSLGDKGALALCLVTGTRTRTRSWVWLPGGEQGLPVPPTEEAEPAPLPPSLPVLKYQCKIT